MMPVYLPMFHLLSSRTHLARINRRQKTIAPIMDLEWSGDICIPEWTITIIIGPSRILEVGLNRCSGTMRRYPFLYVCSNYSGVLPNLHRTSFEFSVRRGFTSDQMATIINECDATYLIIEHDPSLYADDTRLIPSIISRLKTFVRNEGTVVVYSRYLDRFMRSRHSADLFSSVIIIEGGSEKVNDILRFYPKVQQSANLLTIDKFLNLSHSAEEEKNTFHSWSVSWTILLISNECILFLE